MFNLDKRNIIDGSKLAKTEVRGDADVVVQRIYPDGNAKPPFTNPGEYVFTCWTTSDAPANLESGGSLQPAGSDSTLFPHYVVDVSGLGAGYTFTEWYSPLDSEGGPIVLVWARDTAFQSLPGNPDPIAACAPANAWKPGEKPYFIGQAYAADNTSSDVAVTPKPEIDGNGRWRFVRWEFVNVTNIPNADPPRISVSGADLHAPAGIYGLVFGIYEPVTISVTPQQHADDTIVVLFGAGDAGGFSVSRAALAAGLFEPKPVHPYPSWDEQLLHRGFAQHAAEIQRLARQTGPRAHAQLLALLQTLARGG